MMAPTSVSSRLGARPVTPLPKSSISLSMASVRPSILATPSPISRTVPTFCLATEVFMPVIWASISCNRVLIGFSKFIRQLRQPRANASVVHVAAHLHAQTADQFRILVEGNGQARAVFARKVRLHTDAQVFRELERAFDSRRAPRDVQLHEALEVRQDGHVAARFLSDDLLHDLADAVFVQQRVHQTTAEHLLGIPPRPF